MPEESGEETNDSGLIRIRILQNNSSLVIC